MRRAQRGGRRSAAPGHVRIIAGVWRGRRLPVVDLPGLRPTADRIRETLFNWLQARLPGARCLDLFAGTGALGFEAASRGAGAVTLVEQDAAAVRNLHTQAAVLKADQVRIVQADALDYLAGPAEASDIVFLDPPFSAAHLAACCEYLDNRGWLRPGALIYIETDQGPDLPWLPHRWAVIRQGRAGQVHYYLAGAAQDTGSS